MQALTRLFGQSPFAPLQAHLTCVSECVNLVPELFRALQNKDYNLVQSIAKTISLTEYRADCIKNDMRNHIPMGLFMPISRAGILEMISIQDSIADVSEDLGILLTIKQLPLFPHIETIFFEFLNKNMEAFHLVATLIQEFNKLLESSFGGRRADHARSLIRDVAETEHQADVLQRQLTKTLFSDDNQIDFKDLYLWVQVIKTTANISDSAEKLAHRINMTLEEK